MAEAGTCAHEASIVIAPDVKALIPPLAPSEYELLEASLVRDGCRDPLVVWREKGILLDGHNRYEICSRLGITFKVVTMSFATRDEALLYCVENQLARRNLTDIDRIALAARREPMLRARAAKNQGTRTDLPQNSAERLVPIDTREDAAKAAGVSHDTYTKGLSILAHGAPELVEAVRNGDASIHAAAEVAELPLSEQADAVATCRVLEIAKARRSNRRQQNTGNNEWGTPANLLGAVRAVLGTIDVDPASHTGAQLRVKATTFYTKDDDGLSKLWNGNVFLHPPYSTKLVKAFIEKLVAEYVDNHITAAIVLVNNETDTSWFQQAAIHASCICFLRDRVRFLRPDGRPSRSGPLQGQVVLFFGDDHTRFVEVFGSLGFVVTPCLTEAR